MHDFQVLEKLSEGATADVFWAQERGSNERVLMEILRPELTRDPEAMQRFLMEAEFRRSLNHPNIARRVARGQLPTGTPYVVSEPVLGQSLRHCLTASGPLVAVDLVRLIRPLCDAVAYLHQAGLTHGNLSPDLVFLEGGLRVFRPKLLDPGLAFLRIGSRMVLPTRRQLVRPEYLSPERILGQRATPASDVYALGVLLFEALTGRPPFTHSDPEQVRGLHLTAMPPPLPANAKLMSGIIHRCLAKDPADRFGNVMELKESFARPPSAPKARVGSSPLAVATPTPTPPPPGAARSGDPDIVGTYQLLRPLGKGGMGRVFAARHLKLGRLVAIKLLHPELAQNRSFVERLVREAQAANRINHEHIVEIYDFVEEPDSPTGPRYFCVMELLTGLSLEALLRQQALPIGRAARILRQVCSALEAAHDVGVVHRDVKPDNIFLTERHGRPDFVKVLDFGVAKLFSNQEGVTQGGEIIGTPSYMAPEQLTGAEPDARTDVYAFGVVLYRILCGQVPFKSKSFGEHCAKLTRDPPPPLPERTPAGEAVPAPLAQLVMECLAKRPADRPRSMAAVRERLADFEGITPQAEWADPSAFPPAPQRVAEPATAGSGSGPQFPPPLPAKGSANGSHDAAALFDGLADASGVLELSEVIRRDYPGVRPARGWVDRISQVFRPDESALREGPTRLRWVILAGLALVALAYFWGRAGGRQGLDLNGKGTTVEIAVTSTPSGARVLRTDTGREVGTTPFSFRIPRSEQALNLRFEWPGGATTEQPVRRDRDGTVQAAVGSPGSGAGMDLRRAPPRKK